MTLSAGKLWSIRRLADTSGRFKMTAVDQRPPIMDLVRRARGTEAASYADVASVKRALTRCLAAESSAMLLDPIWAYPESIAEVRHDQGLLVTLEDHEFEDTPGGRRSRPIADWSVAKIKRLGADGVKALVWYRPDADEGVRRHQHALVERLGEQCRRHDICFLLELLVYPLPGDDAQTRDYVEFAAKRPALVVDSVRDFADPRLGIDILKLESPIPASEMPAHDEPGAEACQTWFERLAEAAHVPWVMLSAGADMQQFERILGYAYAAGASGYLAGRAIWSRAAQHFPDVEAMCAELSTDAVAYMQRINTLTDVHARPWHTHPSVSTPLAIEGAGRDFPRNYVA